MFLKILENILMINNEMKTLLLTCPEHILCTVSVFMGLIDCNLTLDRSFFSNSMINIVYLNKM